MKMVSAVTLTLESIFSFIFYTIAITSLILWPLQASGVSFHAFANYFPAIVILAVGLTVRLRLSLFSSVIDPSSINSTAHASHIYTTRSSSTIPSVISVPPWALLFVSVLLLACLSITAIGIDSAFSYSWLFAAVASLIIMTRNYYPKDRPGLQVSYPSYSDTLILSAMSLSLVILYLFSSTTNADDTHFVSYIAGLLSHPDEAMFATENIFNEGLPNLIFSLNVGQSWELIIALLANYTGTSHLIWYYLVTPILLIIFVPWVTYSFVRLLLPKYSALATLFALTFLTLWSTYNHLHGFFFVPRFFQGKALLLMLFTPLVCYLTLCWCLTDRLRYLLAIGLGMCACGGVSSTGFYISGLVAGLSLLAFSRWHWFTLARRIALLAIVSLPNLIMLVVVKRAISQVEKYIPDSILSTSSGINIDISTLATTPAPREITSMYWLFGDNYYLFLVLALISSALLLSCFAPTFQRAAVIRWLGLVVLVTFSHPLASFLGESIGPGNLVWRFHWSIPLSIVLALSAAGIMEYFPSLIERFFPESLKSRLLPFLSSRWVPNLVLAGICGGLLILNAGLLSSKYSSTISMLKVPSSAMNAAEYIVKVEKSNDRILAHSLVAEMLPMLQRSSSLVASRPLYWQQPYFSPEETNLRQTLQAYIDSITRLSPNQILVFKQLLLDSNVSVLVVDTLLSKQTTSFLLLSQPEQVDGWFIYRING